MSGFLAKEMFSVWIERWHVESGKSVVFSDVPSGAVFWNGTFVASLRGTG